MLISGELRLSRIFKLVVAARGGNNPRSQMILDLLADHEALQAECEKLRKDAERYRWLRDPCSGAERVVTYSRGDYGRGLMSYTMLDGAIDAAMQPAEQQAPADYSLTPVPDELFVAEFSAWWEQHGQFCRAGGGDYERTFAFEAWRHLYPQLMNQQMAAAEHQPAPDVTALVEADEYQKWLGEILAIIHRDGGHYQLEHGTAKAVADAEATLYKMLAENQRLVEALERIASMDSMSYHSLDSAKITARKALAAHRKQQEPSHDNQ